MSDKQMKVVYILLAIALLMGGGSLTFSLFYVLNVYSALPNITEIQVVQESVNENQLTEQIIISQFSESTSNTSIVQASIAIEDKEDEDTIIDIVKVPVTTEDKEKEAEIIVTKVENQEAIKHMNVTPEYSKFLGSYFEIEFLYPSDSTISDILEQGPEDLAALSNKYTTGTSYMCHLNSLNEEGLMIFFSCDNLGYTFRPMSEAIEIEKTWEKYYGDYLLSIEEAYDTGTHYIVKTNEKSVSNSKNKYKYYNYGDFQDAGTPVYIQLTFSYPSYAEDQFNPVIDTIIHSLKLHGSPDSSKSDVENFKQSIEQESSESITSVTNSTSDEYIPSKPPETSNSPESFNQDMSTYLQLEIIRQSIHVADTQYEQALTIESDLMKAALLNEIANRYNDALNELFANGLENTEEYAHCLERLSLL